MYVPATPPVATIAVHDGLAVTVVGQVAVLLDELLDVLLDVLLEDAEFDVEGTLLLVLMEDTELLDLELDKVSRGVVEMLLVALLERAGVVGAMEVELMTVLGLALDVVLEDTPGDCMLDTVVGVVTETVTMACSNPVNPEVENLSRVQRYRWLCPKTNPNTAARNM